MKALFFVRYFTWKVAVLVMLPALVPLLLIQRVLAFLANLIEGDIFDNIRIINRTLYDEYILLYKAKTGGSK